MTKLTKAQDAAIKRLAKEMAKEKPLAISLHKKVYENLKPFGFVECYVAIPGQNRHYCNLTDAGREYARLRGWLVAEALEETALKVGDRVLASEVCIGDTLYRRVYGEGVVKAIMHDTLSDRGVPYDIRFTFEDGREMFCDRDYIVFRKPTQNAIPALPDSQFVDAATHVRVDSELIDKNEIALGNWQATNDYARKLESELAAARAEIAALQKRVIDFAEWHFDGADPFRYKLIETVISLVEYEKLQS